MVYLPNFMIKPIIKNIEDNINDLKSNKTKMLTRMKKTSEEELSQINKSIGILMDYNIFDETDKIINKETSDRIKKQYEKIKDCHANKQEYMSTLLEDYLDVLNKCFDLLSPYINNSNLDEFERFITDGTLPKAKKDEKDIQYLKNTEVFDLSENEGDYDVEN